MDERWGLTSIWVFGVSYLKKNWKFLTIFKKKWKKIKRNLRKIGKKQEGWGKMDQGCQMSDLWLVLFGIKPGLLSVFSADFPPGFLLRLLPGHSGRISPGC